MAEGKCTRAAGGASKPVASLSDSTTAIATVEAEGPRTCGERNGCRLGGGVDVYSGCAALALSRLAVHHRIILHLLSLSLSPQLITDKIK